MTAPQSVPVGPGETLVEPWVNSPQWADGEQNSDIKMHRRFDVPMDALRPLLNNPTRPFCNYFGYAVGGPYTASTSSVMFKAVVDNCNAGGGVGATTQFINVPSGLYVVSAQIRNGTTSNSDWLLQCALSLAGTPVSSQLYHGQGVSGVMRLGIGFTEEETAVPTTELFVTITAGSYTPDATIGDFLALRQIGW